MALYRGAQVTGHDFRRVTSPDATPGLARDLEGVLASADAAVVVFPASGGPRRTALPTPGAGRRSQASFRHRGGGGDRETKVNSNVSPSLKRVSS
ncbi:hypothetical protein [Methanoculleus sp.]|uniref:hypothetical protein n=1 Tax=Methanoculleus sp. TaxID=90427 RepID=UPI001BD1DCAF|nr:hypothetical protein [Methanoculleus sp.]